jgi:hypothetical protein
MEMLVEIMVGVEVAQQEPLGNFQQQQAVQAHPASSLSKNFINRRCK